MGHYYRFALLHLWLNKEATEISFSLKILLFKGTKFRALTSFSILPYHLTKVI